MGVAIKGLFVFIYVTKLRILVQIEISDFFERSLNLIDAMNRVELICEIAGKQRLGDCVLTKFDFNLKPILRLINHLVAAIFRILGNWSEVLNRLLKRLKLNRALFLDSLRWLIFHLVMILLFLLVIVHRSLTTSGYLLAWSHHYILAWEHIRIWDWWRGRHHASYQVRLHW